MCVCACERKNTYLYIYIHIYITVYMMDGLGGGERQGSCEAAKKICKDANREVKSLLFWCQVPRPVVSTPTLVPGPDMYV